MSCGACAARYWGENMIAPNSIINGDCLEVMRNRIANHDPFTPAKPKKTPRVPKGQLTLFDGGIAS